MSRYTGPRAKVSRRLGVNIYGTAGEAKALDRRPYPPGEHGRTRRRTQNSEYLVQLQEKQKARFTYGLNERQFHNTYVEANRQSGVTGENLLRLLELRLDNIVYRAGWAATRPQARQFVNHGHVNVNGRRVDIPSYRARQGDVVELRTKARQIVADPLEPRRARPVAPRMARRRRRRPTGHRPGPARARADRRAAARAAHRRALQQVTHTPFPGVISDADHAAAPRRAPR